MWSRFGVIRQRKAKPKVSICNKQMFVVLRTSDKQLIIRSTVGWPNDESCQHCSKQQCAIVWWVGCTDTNTNKYIVTLVSPTVATETIQSWIASCLMTLHWRSNSWSVELKRHSASHKLSPHDPDFSPKALSVGHTDWRTEGTLHPNQEEFIDIPISHIRLRRTSLWWWSGVAPVAANWKAWKNTFYFRHSQG